MTRHTHTGISTVWNQGGKDLATLRDRTEEVPVGWRRSGRPPGAALEPIPDTPENVVAAVVQTRPKDELDAILRKSL